MKHHSLMLGAAACLAISQQANAQPNPPSPSKKPVNEALIRAVSQRAATQSPIFVKKLNDGRTTLRGFADLHTHPMAHLAMGGKLLHGAPDVGILMPAGSIWNGAGVGLSGATCNGGNQRAKTVAEALSSCYSSHAGHDLLKNKCGNHIRRVVLDKFEDGKHTNKPHDEDHPPGYPTFVKWPKYNDVLHQQMWVDWIRRAYDGGLRILVALSVNSMTFAKGLDGNNPYDDKATGDLQIAEMKILDNRHDWMNIVESAAELRSTVGEDKLAIILGSELDDIGNFAWSKRTPSAAEVVTEIRRLHYAGVRYIFPVHVIDNYFGGTAIYEPEFPRASKYHFGQWPNIVCASAADGITKKITNGWDVFKSFTLGDAGGSFPTPSCAQGIGFKNSRRLTDLGRIALDEMMSLGMIIDIDHASQATAQDIIDYTGGKFSGYPIVSGHNGLRDTNRSNPEITENSRTASQYQAIKARSGVVGVGIGESTASAYLNSVRAILRAAPNIPINFGSDINGFVIMPRAENCSLSSPCVQYSAAFPQARMESKTWNYNTDGVAHIGLFPDFLRHVENIGGRDVVDKLFQGAEAVAVMWERAESVGLQVRNSTPGPVPIVRHPDRRDREGRGN